MKNLIKLFTATKQLWQQRRLRQVHWLGKLIKYANNKWPTNVCHINSDAIQKFFYLFQRANLLINISAATQAKWLNCWLISTPHPLSLFKAINKLSLGFRKWKCFGDYLSAHMIMECIIQLHERQDFWYDLSGSQEESAIQLC